MKSDVLTLVAGQARTRAVVAPDTPITSRSRRAQRGERQPPTLDQLAVAIRAALRDPNLEVSKVRPFFWSMVETYSDRFRAYPFNTFKALYSDLENRDFPKEEMERIMDRLQQTYEDHHGPRAQPMQQTEAQPQPAFEPDQLDEDIRELRDSLCYASLVDELADLPSQADTTEASSDPAASDDEQDSAGPNDWS